MTCQRKITGEYASRPSPPYVAGLCPGKIRTGNDGRKYFSKRVAGGYRWVALDGRKSRSKSRSRSHVRRRRSRSHSRRRRRTSRSRSRRNRRRSRSRSRMGHGGRKKVHIYYKTTGYGNAGVPPIPKYHGRHVEGGRLYNNSKYNNVKVISYPSHYHKKALETHKRNMRAQMRLGKINRYRVGSAR